jgi:hypothetical protein
MSTVGRTPGLALRKRKCPRMNKNNETYRWLPIDVEGVRLATPCVVEQGCQIQKRVGVGASPGQLSVVIKYKSVGQG